MVKENQKKNSPLVSVIIPSLNRPQAVIDLLECFLKDSYQNSEIVVVEQSDNLDHKLSSFVSSNSEKIKLLREEIKNLPRARNVGLKASRGEIILFMDDDMLFKGDLIGKHIRNYDDPDVLGVMGRVVNTSPSKFQVRKDPKPEENKNFGYLRWYDGRPIPYWNALIKKGIDHMGGGNVSYRRSALEAVGGYDPNFGKGHAVFEDSDASMRVKKLGGKFIFEPEAAVDHFQLEGGTRQKNFEDFRYWYGHNYSLLISKHYPVFLRWFYIVGQISREFVLSVLKINPRLFIHAVRGIRNGLLDFGQGRYVKR